MYARSPWNQRGSLFVNGITETETSKPAAVYSLSIPKHMTVATTLFLSNEKPYNTSYH